MDVCNEWVAENGKPQNQIGRIYQIALSGLREMNLDVNGIIKIVQLVINDNDTVDLPNDFVNYSKIGILGGDGRIHSLGRDNSINLSPYSNECGVQVSTPVTSGTDYPFYGSPLAGAFYGTGEGGAFGLGGGNNAIGYFRIDKANNQIWLANMNVLGGTNIILEYLGDMSVDGEDFIVHPYIIETIKSWVSWKYINGDINTPLGEKDFRRREYFNNLRISKNRYGASTPQEWAAALRVANSATPRF